MARKFPCYLLVYGSLRNLGAQPMHQLVQPSKYIGEGSFPGKLFYLGSYPGAIHVPESEQRVIGEVYELLTPSKTLEVLDRYEGCCRGEPQPWEFHRDLIRIRLKTGTELDAWVYFYNLSPESLEPIESGDFSEFLKRGPAA